MKKNVIVCGLISGVIVTLVMLVSIYRCYTVDSFESSMFLGYASQVLAFSLIFVAVKNYRDKFNNGQISFGKALKIGLLVTLIASTMYVVAWSIAYNFFVPDFMEKYTEHVLKNTPTAEQQEQVKMMAEYKEWYKNPVLFVLLTYTEIIPVGIVISLITALILKRKKNKDIAYGTTRS